MLMLRRIAFVSAPRTHPGEHLTSQQKEQMTALARILQFPFNVALIAPRLSMYQAAKVLAPNAPVEEFHYRTATAVWLRLASGKRDQHMTIISDPQDTVNLVYGYFGRNPQIPYLPPELHAGSAFYADLVDFRIIHSGVVSIAA